MNRTTKNILKYTLELLIVAFGVFLGTYISERNNQRKTDLNTKKALSQIILEINSNSERLENSIAYHVAISSKIDSIFKVLKPKDFKKIYHSNTLFKHNNIPGWRGIGTALLSKNNYESAKIGGVIQELNISTINKISGVYELQNYYKDYSNSVKDKFFSFDSNTKISDVLGLLEMVNKYDILAIEKKLLSEMKKSKKELENRKNNSSFKK